MSAIVLVLTTAAFLLSARSQPADNAAVCAETPFVREAPPREMTGQPFLVGSWYVNDDRRLWTVRSRWLAGSYGNKVLWIRPRGTQLEIAGRRLDGQAPPLKVTIPCCYPNRLTCCYTNRLQASGLYFPEQGCWEVTATAGKNTLTFITRIEPAAPASAAMITLPPASDDCAVRPAPPCK